MCVLLSSRYIPDKETQTKKDWVPIHEKEEVSTEELFALVSTMGGKGKGKRTRKNK
jgi:hypothetical protein